MRKEYNTSPVEVPAYVTPSLQRFGSFRELTRIGLTNNSDGASILSVNSPGSNRQWFPGAGPAEEWERTLATQTTS